ncbi:MAG: gamma-glutamyl-gamma-aminobutyrate hydrolase family protein [Candidatus Thiodiazotropha sp. (ex. Lucinoma kazani)]
MKPIICITGDNKSNDDLPSCAVYRKYIEVVIEGARGIPWVLPPDKGILDDVEQVISKADGILLTGSLSNIEPHHYQGPDSVLGTLHDPERDALTLPLIEKAIEQKVPILGICRGFQELNVAMGGSLYQNVHELPEMLDHRDNHQFSEDIRYGPSHEIMIEPGGILEQAVGLEPQQVNSLHCQGINRLGDGLFVEARAPDGLIEAVSVNDIDGFAIAIQWHPEWEFQKNQFYLKLIQLFGEACHAHAMSRVD